MLSMKRSGFFLRRLQQLIFLALGFVYLKMWILCTKSKLIIRICMYLVGICLICRENYPQTKARLQQEEKSLEIFQSVQATKYYSHENPIKCNNKLNEVVYNRNKDFLIITLFNFAFDPEVVQNLLRKKNCLKVPKYFWISEIFTFFSHVVK